MITYTASLKLKRRFENLNYNAKVILSLVGLTAFIICTSILAQSTLGKTSDELDKYILQVENSTTSNDWKTAELNVAQIKDKWSRIKGLWAILIDHQEIDNIDVTLSRMEKYIQTKDISSSMAEASALRKFIGHIPVKERLSFENVF